MGLNDERKGSHPWSQKQSSEKFATPPNSASSAIPGRKVKEKERDHWFVGPLKSLQALGWTWSAIAENELGLEEIQLLSTAKCSVFQGQGCRCLMLDMKQATINSSSSSYLQFTSKKEVEPSQPVMRPLHNNLLGHNPIKRLTATVVWEAPYYHVTR